MNHRTPRIPFDSASNKKVFIKTYGCQMNIYDSERMEEILVPLGFQKTDQPDNADLIILNTCHIRAKAEDKLFSDLGRMHIIKKARMCDDRTTLIVVAGCVGQALGKDILKRAPYVNMVVGPQTYHTLPETITRLMRKEQKNFVALGFPAMEKFDALPRQRTLKGPSAFLSIQEGCNKFCRYCVVPYTRGPEYSRPVSDLLNEAQKMIDAGVKEITLLGQNVNAYHGLDTKGKESSLGQLIVHLADTLPRLERIRYMTSHPRDVDDDLIAAHRDVPALMPFLHLPVQSGSDRILARMNRQHTRDFYFQIIERFAEAQPNIAFSSDFIVGYPDETDQDFQDTCDLVHKVRFAQAFSFKYSPRPGTPAAVMTQVPEPVKDQRLQHLQAILNSHRLAFNQSFQDQRLNILVEKRDFKTGRYTGRSPFMHTVHFDGPPCSIGDTIPVHIHTVLTNSLIGTACPQEQRPLIAACGMA